MKSKFLIVSIISILFLVLSLSAGDIKRVEIGNLVLEDVPEIPAELTERFLQYQKCTERYIS